MNEFVKDDKVYRVPIQDGELQMSPAHDFLHYFAPIGAWILKYLNAENNPPTMHTLYLNNEQAEFLIENCELEVLHRKHIRYTEYQGWIEWLAGNLNEEDFGLDFEP